MKHILILFVAFGILFCSCNCAEAANPFLSKSKQKEIQKEESETQVVNKAPSLLIPGFLAPLLQISNSWQKKLKRQLTIFTRDMKKNPFGKSLLLFLLFSFLYGIIHAIGPGHGKSVVISYFLNRRGKLMHGVLMGNLITAVHVASGAMVVLVMALFLNTTRLIDFDAASPTLEAISYSLIILVGLYLLFHTSMEIRGGKLLSDQEETSMANKKEMLVTAIVTGLIPCPGAALILLFSIVMGVTLQGIMAMFFIALGMGLTTTVFALLTIGTRHSIMATAKHNKHLFIGSYLLFSVGGATAIILIGSLMLAGVLQS